MMDIQGKKASNRNSRHKPIQEIPLTQNKLSHQ